MALDPAREWLSVAEDDIRQIVNNLDGPLPSLTGAAYHCQQAGEKIVKALLVSLDIDPPRSHDIAALLGLLPMDQALRATLSALSDLTPYAVAYRYPAEDEWETPTREALVQWLATIREAIAMVDSNFDHRSR